jgi:hypothetical protein
MPRNKLMDTMEIEMHTAFGSTNSNETKVRRRSLKNNGKKSQGLALILQCSHGHRNERNEFILL